MNVTHIENEALRVGVMPDYGGRVVSLFDKAAGREWLVQGAPSASTAEDARYTPDEAVGWDECFPTVSAWDASGTIWGRRLRDHGDLWGRPFVIEARDATSLAVSRTTPEFRFARTLSLQGPMLVARYEVDNRTDRALPYLWALHALLTVTEADRMLLAGVEQVRAVHLSVDGQFLPAASLPWSGNNDALAFPLEAVQPASTAVTAKLYAEDVPGGRALVGRDGAWLELAWDGSIHHLGIWLTYGGWPAPGGRHEVALEPTNAPADHLGQAIEGGADPLPPGGHHAFEVTLTVRR